MRDSAQYDTSGRFKITKIETLLTHYPVAQAALNYEKKQVESLVGLSF